MYPIAGTIFCYSDLARFFSPQKPFYAIQALPAHEARNGTLEEIASGCLQLIKKRNRCGHYELGGWSFGGLLALELAQQATASGDPPATLYLLDPPVPEDLLPAESEDELIELFTLTLITDISAGKPVDLERLKTQFDPEKSSLKARLEKAIELGLLPQSASMAAHVPYFEVFKPQHSRRTNLSATEILRPNRPDLAGNAPASILACFAAGGAPGGRAREPLQHAARCTD
jgi:pyochelin synthetase